MSANHADWSFSPEPVGDLARLEARWRERHAAWGDSFFLSWNWIGTWLASLPDPAAARLLTASCRGQLAGLAVLVEQRRANPLSQRALLLHETGDSVLDSLFIEHNGLLCDPATGGDALRRAVPWLLDGPASELRLSGVDAGLMPPASMDGVTIQVTAERPVFAVALAAVAGATAGAALSANGRQHLGKSLRRFGELGDLSLARAGGVDEALDWFGDMTQLHQARWTGRGKPGSFAAQAVIAFHRRLIAVGQPRGTVDLLRCRAGDRTVGLLYNFRTAGTVYNYQSGFDYSLADRASPGWVCHALALEHYARQGCRTYDLLAGESAFKERFGQRTGALVWLKVRKTGMRSAAAAALDWVGDKSASRIKKLVGR
jgi:CelD/BcsL family acetyltransferase involved in cellulose biosynthesis